MKRISSTLRIVLGLVCVLFSVMLSASTLGLIPDRQGAIMQGRAALCEAVALNSSVYVGRRDMGSVRAILEAIVARNTDLQTAAVRRADGELFVDVGDHTANWVADSKQGGTAGQVYVPIFTHESKEQQWGTVEFRFRPVSRTGIIGLLLRPTARLVGFVAIVSFVLYFFYLRKMLQHLDPSKAVPERVRSALDTLAEGLLVVDKQERIVLANKAFAQTVGESQEALQGRNASKFDWSHPEQPNDTKAPWLDAIQSNAPSMGVMLGFEDSGGHGRTFIVNSAPVLGEDGEARGALSSFEDVTELEEHKVELSKSKDEAEAANSAKSEFLARMSHEIRTPMNAVLGFTDVMRRGLVENDAERDEYLQIIHTSGKHLLDLINDILDLSKVESGHLEIERQRLVVHQLVSEIATVLRVKAQEKGIALEYEWSGSVPETIESDPTRLKQVLTNVIGNAIKFTDQGSVRVVVRTQKRGRRDTLTFQIIDTGIGMTPETCQRIFDPFVQADTSITRRFGGTGLGLSISRRLAQALGGDLTAHSKPGHGSTFTITIDPGSLKGVQMLDVKPVDLIDRRTTSRSQIAVSLPAAKILLVDDGETNRRLIRLVLQRAGVTIVEATNGQEAVDAASADQFDAILMDMQMPVMNGYDAAGTLRARGDQTPIIALTANAMKGDEEKCRQAGCSGFLSKPIDIDRLLATLGQLLGAGEQVNGAPIAPEHEDAADEPQMAIHSSLPTDDPEFAAIVEEFVEHLRERLATMQSHCDAGQLDDLAREAHWLKGSGGTAGFDVFTVPAAELEQLAKRGDADAAGKALTSIQRTAARISLSSAAPTDVSAQLPGASELAPPQPSAKPIQSSLPTDDVEFCEIIDEFIEGLNGKLEQMQAAMAEVELGELASLAHWLKGAGGTAGFADFTDPAARLERLAKDGQVEHVEDAIAELVALVGRIQPPSDRPTDPGPGDTTANSQQQQKTTAAQDGEAAQ